MKALAAALLLCALCAGAQEPRTLSYALDDLVGHSLRYEAELLQTLDLTVEDERKVFSTETTSTYRYDFVLGARRRFEMQLQVEGLRLATGREGETPRVYDSADPDGTDGALGEALQPLLEGSTGLRMQESGSRMRLSARETGVEKRLLGIFQAAWPAFPEIALAPGDTWQRELECSLQRGIELRALWSYELTRFVEEEGRLLAELDATLALRCDDDLLGLDEGRGSARFRFDVEGGFLRDAEGEIVVRSFGPGSETAIRESFRVRFVEQLATPR